jgi:hypothetical protein
MPDETKTHQLNLRLRPSLKKLADQAAADDNRTLTSLIEKLLSDYLRARGYMEPTPAARFMAAANAAPRDRPRSGKRK